MRWKAGHPAPGAGSSPQKYIAAQFRRLGLEPAGDSGTYFQRVPDHRAHPDADARGDRAFRHAADVEGRLRPLVHAERSQRQRARRAVFVGYGIVAPELGWNDYAGLDAKGKIVVALVNDPGLQDSTIFRGKILTYYGRWTYKIEEARRQGAAGILLVHTTESATYPWTTVLSGWTGPQVRLESPPDSLVVAGWLPRRPRRGSSSRAGRIWRRSAAAAAKGFRRVPLGRHARGRGAQHDPPLRDRQRARPAPGTGALAKEAVLIGGHYDHFGIGAPVDGDSIYNGAEDNASGTAAVLAAAEAFVRSGVRTARSLVFVGFAAEESGLIGSQALANNPPIPLRDIAAILNLDVMNLYGRTRTSPRWASISPRWGRPSRRPPRRRGSR